MPWQLCQLWRIHVPSNKWHWQLEVRSCSTTSTQKTKSCPALIVPKDRFYILIWVLDNYWVINAAVAAVLGPKGVSCHSEVPFHSLRHSLGIATVAPVLFIVACIGKLPPLYLQHLSYHWLGEKKWFGSKQCSVLEVTLCQYLIALYPKARAEPVTHLYSACGCKYLTPLWPKSCWAFLTVRTVFTA